MTMDQDYANFSDKEFRKEVFIDKRGNEFSVRMGTFRGSIPTGTIVPTSDEDLNNQLSAMYKKYLNDKI